MRVACIEFAQSGAMRGYLLQPTGPGPFPVARGVHENRGLNPGIADAARRPRWKDFSLSPAGLSPVSGYPGNDEDGRTLQATLDQVRLRTGLLNSSLFLRSHQMSTGKPGTPGFRYGGGAVSYLTAGVPCQVHSCPGTQHGFDNNSTLQQYRSVTIAGTHCHAFQDPPLIVVKSIGWSQMSG